MQTKNIVILSVIGLGAVLLASSAISNYNSLVPAEEKVNISYAQYQNQLKRQADLIPNLAEITKGYMTSEQKTMIETATARAGDAAKMKPSDVANNPELQKKLVEAQAQMGRAMATINATREAYPELKASKQIDSLMVEVAGTQNRITVARGNNQKAVNEFNLEVRQFPRVIVAKLIGFSAKPYYEATAEEQNAPKLNFSK